MFIAPRTQESCQREIEDVEEYAGRIFGIEVDFAAFKMQIREIIANRVNDFIFQRFRDWPIADLLKLEQAVTTRIMREAKEPESTIQTGKRGRPIKVD